MQHNARREVAQTLRAAAKVLAADTDTTALLKKARETLKRLDTAQKALTEAVTFSDEGTIKPALAALAKLQKVFQKQEEALSKVIRDAASASAPPELKAEAKKVEKLLRARLVDPKGLKVIPWQTNGIGRTPSVDYQYVFRIPEVKTLNSTQKYDATLSVVVGGDSWEKPDVLQQMTSALSMKANYKSAKDFVETIVEQLQSWGWAGIAGEAEANKGRAQTATQIAAAINDVTQRLGHYDRRDAEINLPRVEGEYRSNLPKEGERAVGEDRYREMVNKEIAQCRKLLDQALAPFKAQIKDVQIDDEEKSWIRITVTLK